MMPDFNMVVCNQCGLNHPPLKPDEVCPMAKEKTSSGEEIVLDSFFIDLKNIVLSQIKTKDIKNVKKILAFCLLIVAKTLEKYKE